MMRKTAMALACACMIATLSGCATTYQMNGGASASDVASDNADAPDNTDASNNKENAANDAIEKADYKGVRARLASYPNEGAFEGVDAQAFMDSDAHWEWWDAYRLDVEKSTALQDGMDDYYAALTKALLVDAAEEKENAVCSPLNIYLALAALAETTDGETRAQILNVLQTPTIEALRERTKALWAANWADTPTLTSRLATSAWLREGAIYNEETLRRLAEEYYASTIYGEMGSDDMNRALQGWTNENTGGLLKDSVRDLKTDESTVLALVSTIYYKAGWVDKFNASETNKQIFHGEKGDTEVDMMHMRETMTYFRGENFGAIALNLNDSGAMYFFLPDEGTDVKDVVQDARTLQIARGRDTGFNQAFGYVNLSAPKFKAQSQTDLIKPLRALGIVDAMEAGLADFSPLTTEIGDLYLSSASHAAAVEVDEDGVTGAAYTIMMVAEGAFLDDGEEIEFTLDRPFYFIATGRDNSVLFAGVVRNVD